jgi:prolyl-tRNA editing enzyme YbaK/EbsC (Cys-tRNA(Pro) deacylase)
MSDLAPTLKRIACCEERITRLEMDAETIKVKRDLEAKQVFSFKFTHTLSNYYDTTLQMRADFLGVGVPQLCKTVLFENLAKSDIQTTDASDSKYYLVVVQYQAKIDVDLLRDMIIDMRQGDKKLSKKRFNFMLAPEEVSNKLTGFRHNGVCPFGLQDKTIPIILCKRLLELPLIYLGGGHPQLKLCVSTKDFSECEGVYTGTSYISNPRSRLEMEEAQ